MTGFFSKLFGKKNSSTEESPSVLIENVLAGLVQEANFRFDYEVLPEEKDPNHINIEIFGEDEDLLRARDGQLLDAIQLFLTRVVQHQLRDERVTIHVDNSGFREHANQELTDLAEKLKSVALDRGKPVYFRALPPRERKVIHQYLAGDARVKSRSVGEGLYKKIKIYPAKGESNPEHPSERY